MLMVSPVRVTPNQRLQAKNDHLPIVRGRFSNLSEAGGGQNESISVGLFTKSQSKIKTLDNSPEAHEASIKRKQGADLFAATSVGQKACVHISVEQVEHVEKSMREMRLKICSSPVRQQGRKDRAKSKAAAVRDGMVSKSTSAVGNTITTTSSSGSTSVMSPLHSCKEKGENDVVKGKQRTMTMRSSTRAMSTPNPWARNPPPSSSFRGRDDDGDDNANSGTNNNNHEDGDSSSGGSNGSYSRNYRNASSSSSGSNRRRKSSNTRVSLGIAERRNSNPNPNSAVSVVASHARKAVLAAQERVRARSSQSAERNNNATMVETTSTPPAEIEMYRAAAHGRVTRALEKQRQARVQEQEKESNKRQRGDNAAEKQKERQRYRAQVYAINAFLRKQERARFTEFKALQKEAGVTSDSSDEDDNKSIDSDDSGSIGGDAPSTPSTPSTPTREQVERVLSANSPGRGGRTAPFSPGGASVSQSVPSPAPSPSRFGGV